MQGARLGRIRKAFSLLALVTAASAFTAAEIRLPHMLSDHAVLQRQRPIHIWGWSEPNEAVSLTFHQQRLRTVANPLGQFSAWLLPEEAGGPYTLTVAGEHSTPTLTVDDLLVGDVWFASGQSNMEMPLKGFGGQTVIKDSAHEIASSAHPNIRLLRLEHRASDFPQVDVAAVWTTCEPSTASDFSAVAYFFGRELAEKEHVPIGLIDSTWGGTPIDSWMSLDAISSNASLMPVFSARSRFAAHQDELQRTIASERRADAEAKAGNQAAPQHPWHPDERSWTPGLLFNGMVAPATPYTIRGFLWYQGETDSSIERAPMYARLFPTLIADWRSSWSEGELPFLYVQISSFDSPPEVWGVVRDAQRQTLSVANTAMAVSLDRGEAKNVHPPDKQTIGHRLALGAGRLSYGAAGEWSGPLFRQATVEAATVQVWFDHANKGLRVHEADLPAAGELRGFELAGEDGRFLPAKASIQNATVLVQTEAVPHPRAVRYAWANVTDANLYNTEGLPASTFTAPIP